MTGLRKLTIYASQMTGAGLAALEPLANLQDIYLFGCDSVTDDGLAHSRPDHEPAQVEHQPIRTADQRRHGPVTVAAEPGVVDVGFHAVTTDTVLESLRPMPSLRRLELTYWQHAGNGGLQYLAGFERLESLVLNGNHGLTDADWRRYRHCRRS